MALVAGIDSSTQSCKVVIRDAETGALVRDGRASHPDGTEVDPAHWWRALHEAVTAAGGLDDVAAIAVGAQQRRMVTLDEVGDVVRPALLWNDTRSAPQARRLTDELGGPQAWADGVGSVPVASFTVTSSPGWPSARRTPRRASPGSPHDWLTWKLAGATGLDALTTDRGDASGTGYYSPAKSAYRRDILTAALGHDATLPRVLGPTDLAGTSAAQPISTGALLGPGTGDNIGGSSRRRRRTGRRDHCSRSAPPEWSRRWPRYPPPTPAAPWPASPTPPGVTCPWSAL